MIKAGGTAWKSFRHALLLAGVFSLAADGLAQTTGQVRIMSVPDQGLRYVVDDKYVMTDRQITLAEGDHRFVFWAPEHEMLDTSLFVMGNYTINLNIRLQRPPEYIAHREAVDLFHRRQRLARTIPPIITGGIGIWAAVNTLRFGQAHSDLKDLRTEYDTSSDPGRIMEMKETAIPEAKDRFRDMRTQTYISSALFAASLGATAYLRYRSKRASPPEYEDKERVRFEGLVWLPGPQGGSWATGISLALQ